MKEVDYYPAFVRWLKDQHIFSHQNPYWVFDSVRIHPNELDIVSLYKHRKKCFYITSIEVKLSDFKGVFQQALLRSTFCNYCYIAFPVADYLGSMLHQTITHFDLLKEHGIGVLVFDDLRRRIWKVLNSTRSKFVTQNNTRTKLIQKLNELSKGEILKEIQGIERFLPKKQTTPEESKISIEELVAYQKQTRKNEVK
jgi:hypothetical protein